MMHHMSDSEANIFDPCAADPRVRVKILCPQISHVIHHLEELIEPNYLIIDSDTKF